MTTQTFASNAVMAYVGPDAGVVGVSGLTVMPVWGGSQVFFLQPSVAGPGIRQFSIDTPGAETLQQTQATLGLSVISASSGGAAAITPDGTELHFISGTGNSVQCAQIQASDLTLLHTFGTASNSTLPSTTTLILAMDKMTATNSNLVCGSASSLQEIDSIGLAGFNANVNCGDLDTAGVQFGTLVGPGGANDAYILGVPFANGVFPSTASLSLYKLLGGSLTKLGSLAPASVDATWTHFFQIVGIAYDATDGNLIIGAQTSDAVATQQYILKIRSSNASVMWTRAIVTLNPYPWGFTFSRITSGKFHYIDGTTARHINTSTGAQTTETVSQVAVTGPQASDDVTNSIIFYGQFTAGGSNPQFVGTYMGPPGNNHNVNGWMRYWFATAIPPYHGSGRRLVSIMGPIN